MQIGPAKSSQGIPISQLIEFLTNREKERKKEREGGKEKGRKRRETRGVLFIT